MRRGIRFLVLVCLSILCVGMIVHSARAVRYSVGSDKLSEFTVTELSLSHEIERGHDGRLRSPGEEPEHTTESINELVGNPKPAPQAAGKQVAETKPAPKKQTVVKPASRTTVKKASAKKPSSSKPAVKTPVKKPTVKQSAPSKPVKKETPPKKPAKKPCPT